VTCLRNYWRCCGSGWVMVTNTDKENGMEKATDDLELVRWRKMVGGGQSWWYLVPETWSPILAACHEDDLFGTATKPPSELLMALNGKTRREAELVVKNHKQGERDER